MRSRPVHPPPRLTDGEIALRMRCAADVAPQLDAAGDPETSRWLDDLPPDPKVPADTEAVLKRTAENFAAGRAATLTIADAATDEPLGLLNVQFRSDDLATIAYSTFPACRGRGIAGRAVDLAQRWAFDDLGLTELRLEIDPANLASRRVAEKAGWTLLSGVVTDDDKHVFARRVDSEAYSPGAAGTGRSPSESA